MLVGGDQPVELTHLDLSFNPVHDEGLTALASSPVARSITDLTVPGPTFSPVALASMGKARFERLRRLYVGAATFDRAAAESWRSASWNRDVEELTLLVSPADDDATAALFGTDAWDRLRVLNLYGKIGPKTMTGIASLGATRLWGLALQLAVLDDAAVEAMQDSACLSELVWLVLDSCPLSRQQAKLLAAGAARGLLDVVVDEHRDVWASAANLHPLVRSAQQVD